MAPIISIIVPVYNVEKYLRECLDSIIAQSFTDWECILVDDGSKDSSPKICDEYAERDNRFRAIHKVNGGPSSARNLGIETACGDYIFFMDSDDYIEPDTLETMLGIATKHDTDVVVSAYDYKNPSESGSWLPSEHNIPVLSKDNEVIASAWFRFYWAPWNKLYRSSIIKIPNLKYNVNLNVGEDMLFHLSLYPYITSIASTDTVQYHYRYVEGSLDSASSRKKNNINLMQAKIVRYLVEHLINVQNDNSNLVQLRQRLWTSQLLHKLLEYLLDIKLYLCHSDDKSKNEVSAHYKRSINTLNSVASLSKIQHLPFMYLRLPRPWMRVVILNKLAKICFK
jgi:glycosyltransferase involved in cell wall biosynthesis